MVGVRRGSGDGEDSVGGRAPFGWPAEGLPEWLVTPLFRAVRDMQLPSAVPLSFDWAPDGADGGILCAREDGGGTVGRGFWKGPGAALTVAIADWLQEQVFPESQTAWGEARPVCPGHPHAARPTLVNERAWWVCPRERYPVARIGAVGLVLRPLEDRDGRSAPHHVALAVAPAGSAMSAEDMRAARVRRWLDGWGNEVGFCAEADRGGLVRLVGATWIRVVYPVLVFDRRSGRPLPELILSVETKYQDLGIGADLLARLLDAAAVLDIPGIAVAADGLGPAGQALCSRFRFKSAAGEKGRRAMVWRPGVVSP